MKALALEKDGRLFAYHSIAIDKKTERTRNTLLCFVMQSKNPKEAQNGAVFLGGWLM